MIALASGAVLVLTIFGAPRYGIVARRVRRVMLGVRIAREDLLAALYRLEEGGADGDAEDAGRLEMIRAILERRDVPSRLAARRALRRGEIVRSGPGFVLAPPGRALAASIIRSHRLWETYLVEEVGLRPDHVHDTAMRLEHATTARGERIAPPIESEKDPHGRVIPGSGGAE